MSCARSTWPQTARCSGLPPTSSSTATTRIPAYSARSVITRRLVTCTVRRHLSILRAHHHAARRTAALPPRGSTAAAAQTSCVLPVVRRRWSGSPRRRTQATRSAVVRRLLRRHHDLASCEPAEALLCRLRVGISRDNGTLLDSQPGDTVGQGVQRDLTPVDGTFRAFRNHRNGVNVGWFAPPGMPSSSWYSGVRGK